MLCFRQDFLLSETSTESENLREIKTQFTFDCVNLVFRCRESSKITLLAVHCVYKYKERTE